MEKNKKKAIEDQGEKQIKAIQNQGQSINVEKYYYNDKDIPLISRQKEIFNKLVDERLDEITKLEKKVNSDDLIYQYKSPTADAKFNESDNALDLIDKLRGGKIGLKMIKWDSNQM